MDPNIDEEIIDHIIDCIEGGSIPKINDADTKHKYFSILHKLSCLFDIMSYRLNLFKSSLTENITLKADDRLTKPITELSKEALIKLIYYVNLDKEIIKIYNELPSTYKEIIIQDQTRAAEIISVIKLFHKWTNMPMINSITQ